MRSRGVVKTKRAQNEGKRLRRCLTCSAHELTALKEFDIQVELERRFYAKKFDKLATIFDFDTESVLLGFILGAAESVKPERIDL